MLALLAEPDLELVPHAADYRVDGEVGRFRFGTFDLKKPQGPIVFSGTSLLPPLKGREWYETSGFKQVALVMGTVQRSYRKTTDAFNYSRRQLQGGTPLNTLRDTAESEGMAVLKFLDTEATRVLQEHHFAADGTPPPEALVHQEAATPPATLGDQKIHEARLAMQQEMRKRGMPESHVQAAGGEDKTATQQKQAVYEDPGATVNISVDDVGVKEQKQQRDRPNKHQTLPGGATDGVKELASQESERKRPMAYTTVARIEHAGHGFTLVGAGVLVVLWLVLAFLLNNKLRGKHWVFFTDGQRNLQNSVVAFFGWYRWMSVILDWFHLIKKCKEELSLGLKGRTLRNEHLKQIARFLWYGLVSEAVEYVRAIPEEHIKNKEPLERLIGYFERNRAWIPCYALRRRLGLRNASNPVERTCNLVTSCRQKHNGMSWSPSGSLALAAITSVVLNNHTQKWLKQKVVPLVFSQAL
jgi:hypothetical protein